MKKTLLQEANNEVGAVNGVKSAPGWSSWVRKIRSTAQYISLPRFALSFCLGIIFSFSANAQTVPASNIVISPISAQTARMRFDWTNGDGANRIVILQPLGASYTPSGVAPASNPNFGAGADLGGGTKCVFNSSTDGGGTTVSLTGGLAQNTDYTVHVYEYTGTTYYLRQGPNNPLSFSCLLVVSGRRASVQLKSVKRRRGFLASHWTLNHL